MPEGTIPVAIGLVITGLSAYAFLSLTRYGLGTDASTPVNQLWFATFILAPGFFLPVEQEVGRALAHRRALGEGGLPVLRKAALLALGLLAIVGIFLLTMSPFLTRELFDGSWVLFGCLLLAFAGYALGHFLRGTFAGTGRFQQYGLFMASDGLIRFTACAVLAVTGVTFLGAYGLLVGVPPFLAVFIALRGNYHLTTEGPPADWGELTPNLGWLVAGSVAAAALVNAGPLAAKLLADDTQSAIVSEFSYAVLVARVPLFMFQAVQAALLPKLARLAAQGLYDDFRQGFRRLMQVVVVVGPGRGRARRHHRPGRPRDRLQRLGRPAHADAARPGQRHVHDRPRHRAGRHRAPRPRLGRRGLDRRPGHLHRRDRGRQPRPAPAGGARPRGGVVDGHGHVRRTRCTSS